jgi:hypothetical protein
MDSCGYMRKCLYGNQIFKGNEQIIKIYKNLFCEAGESKILTCKRYQVMRMAGYCPSSVLPNSMASSDSIMNKMQIENKLKFIRA